MRYLYINLLLICFFSCTKEPGFVPPTELHEPHYMDLKPDLLWEVKCLEEDEDGITAMEVIDNRVIVLTYFNVLQVYDIATGNLINEEKYDRIFSEKIDDFKLREHGSSLYILDESNHQFIQLNKETGKIIDIYNPPDTFSNILLSFGMEVIDEEAYFYKYTSSYSYTFVKYNYITRHEEVIKNLSSLDLTFSKHQASFYYPELEKFYACTYNQIGQLIIFSIDKNSGKLEILKKMYIEDEFQHAMDLIVVDDILIIEISDRLIQGLNIHTGNPKWEFESPNNYYLTDVFSHLGNTYLNFGDDLYQINPQDGSILWESQYFSEASIFDLLPYDRIAVTTVEDLEMNNTEPPIRRRKDKSTIYDLKTGKRLVEWEIKEPEAEGNLLFKEISYSENNNNKYIIVATDNYLFNYQWPF